MYRMIWPKATADEVRRYIFDENPFQPRLYSRTDICRAEKYWNVRGKDHHRQLLTKHWSQIIFFEEIYSGTLHHHRVV